MYKIPLLERAKGAKKMQYCEDCIHKNPTGSRQYCYMFRHVDTRIPTCGQKETENEV